MKSHKIPPWEHSEIDGARSLHPFNDWLAHSFSSAGRIAAPFYVHIKFNFVSEDWDNQRDGLSRGVFDEFA
jgi:hypothetical protein